MEETDARKRLRTSAETMENMNLYRDSKMEQILTEAVRIAYSEGFSLNPEHFARIDRLHYLGDEGILFALSHTRVDNTTKIIDIGAGVGGTPRWLVWKYKCHVTAVEYQEKLCRVGDILNRLMLTNNNNTKFNSTDLTRSFEQSQDNSDEIHIKGNKNINLYNLIEYITGDFTTMNTDNLNITHKYDLLISQLAMLHIPDKSNLYKNCGKVLKTSGHFFIEDFFVRNDLTEEEHSWLEDDVGTPKDSLLTKEQYIKYLESNGMIVDIWEDKTEDFSHFVWGRYEHFLKDESNNSKHGEEFQNDMKHFYHQICKLFHNESQQGIITKHPKVHEQLKVLKLLSTTNSFRRKASSQIRRIGDKISVVFGFLATSPSCLAIDN